MHHPCFQNKFLIILVLLLCGIVLFFSCFNCTYLGYGSRTPITGLFRAALIISNAIFLTFNAGMVPCNFDACLQKSLTTWTVNSQRRVTSEDCFSKIPLGMEETCASMPEWVKSYFNSTETSDENSLKEAVDSFVLTFQSLLNIAGVFVALLLTIRSAFSSAEITKSTKREYLGWLITLTS